MSSLEDDENQVIHDAFVECLETHQETVKMDFDLWLKGVVTMILNKANGDEWAIAELRKFIDHEARRHGKLLIFITPIYRQASC